MAQSAIPLSSLNTKMYVTLSLPATHDAAGFSAAGMVYKEVGELADLGEVGGESSSISVSNLSSGTVQKLKGLYDPGSTTIQLNKVADDGQEVLKTAAAPDYYNNIAFKVVYPDGTIDYMLGLVRSYKTTGISSDSVIQATVMVDWNKTVVEVTT